SGRRFHDGTTLTARDVEATYASILNPDSASPHRASLGRIVRIEVVDDDTLDFYLEQPDPLFPGRLVVGITPAGRIAAGHPLHNQPIGSGPFTFLDWESEGRLRLRRESDGQVVTFLRVPDPTVRVLKLLRGEVDLLQGDLPPELLAWLNNRHDVQVRHERGSNFTYLGFNLQDPVVASRPLRLAIAHALDREEIIRYVMGGAARSASALLPPDHWAGNSALLPNTHAPGESRRLLAELGYSSSNRPEITYKTSSNPFRVRLATVIQHQLKEVGIDVDIRSYDWGTFYGDIKAGRFQMYSLSWVGIKMPDIFRYVFHSDSVPPVGANRGRYVNTVVDSLIDRAEGEPDLERQALLYRELQAYLLHELPYVPLWYEDHVFVARQNIHGYKVAMDGNFDGLLSVRRSGAK
ncbi:MAG: ABC transporter substrate-binding protein, partial [Gammaproteobacteria bacterium]|nr:ABC transporter substrate-binding protein [Gammaproteobacteria bacterium]